MSKSVLVVGGGGREHALCRSLSQSESISDVHVSPGNAGTLNYATNHSVSASDVDGLVSLSRSLGVDFVVVGPEAPLCDSIADILLNHGIPCFGPQAIHAELEGSKLFAKEAMRRADVPTADYVVLDSRSDIESALSSYSDNPWVIKRDVLAGGKGVVVTTNLSEAVEFIYDSIKTDGHVLLESFLPGEEASMLVVMDASGFVCLPPSQDHKRVWDGDKGLNTGGMGAYCPAPVVTEEIHQKVLERIVKPMHESLSGMDVPYRGVLYVGLMIDENGDPFVVEFNVRFGDPECQVTLPLIASDVGELLYAASTDSLETSSVSFHDMHCLTVVLASEGYPQSAMKGRIILGAERAGDSDDAWVSHAGTGTDESNRLISTGGRVLASTSIASSLAEARALSYKRMETISLQGSHHRNDIGHRAL